MVRSHQAYGRQAEAVEPLEKLLHKENILSLIHLWPFDTVPFGFVHRGEQLELEVASGRGVIDEGSDHFHPLVFSRKGDVRAAHPRGDWSQDVEDEVLGNAFVIEVCHGASKCLELEAGVGAIVGGLIKCMGITIIIARFPICIIDDNPEDRCPQLIDQHIYGRPQFSILPADTINIDPKAIDSLKRLGAVDDQRSPARAKAINESPMTIVEIDTTAAIVEAAMIFFRHDPYNVPQKVAH
jgi:hypothetical protein